MKKILLPIVGLTFLVGCASSKPTSAERIANVGQSFVETEEKLSESESELASFERSVTKLRDSASRHPSMRAKAGFDEALAKLGSRIEETRLDLQQLKLANEREKNEYSNQLGEAASRIEMNSRERAAE